MEHKLDFGTVFKEGFANGMKNLPSLIGAFLLWILTIWIPYINVGTTIAICTIPIQLSKGTIFSPLSIFNKKYYRYIGEFFLTAGLMYIGIMIGIVFLIIPGIVIGIAWSLAMLLLLDKGVNAAEALRLSNKLTYGNKWTIFFVSLVLGICFFIAAAIISALFSLIGLSVVGGLLIICLLLAYFAISVGCTASIYGTLAKDVPEEH